MKEAIVKGLVLQAEDFKTSGFDSRDAQVCKLVVYEFDVEIDNKVMPLKLLEDVNRWEYVDFTIFQTEHPVRPGDEHGLLPRSCGSSVDIIFVHCLEQMVLKTEVEPITAALYDFSGGEVKPVGEWLFSIHWSY
ncbi:quasimodo2 like [Striga asiatica]|uniref:Quasimodo2 like n=1 Tax=Striga asiatica TaxID=4170 RepID=A0A5A7PRC4_STRAF|nr:quasimodo2 like [Striga asiatica]